MSQSGAKRKIECSSLKLGVCFSAPVYFDDGENMFLSAKNPVKKYHLNAITRWEIPFLLTDGYILSDKEVASIADEKAKAEDISTQMEEIDASFFGITEDD
ncbi:MAG: phosphohydrolase [Treponema sp.]|nr:phosphohydrolase [Treponema sp.]